MRPTRDSSWMQDGTKTRLILLLQQISYQSGSSRRTDNNHFSCASWFSWQLAHGSNSPFSWARHETRVQIPHGPEESWHALIVYHELERPGKEAIESLSRVKDLQFGRTMAVRIISKSFLLKKAKKKISKKQPGWKSNWYLAFAMRV